MDAVTKVLDLPVVATRGVIYFPGNTMTLDVGRPMSVFAVNEARRAFNDYFIILSQSNPMIDEPGKDDLFKIGTICHIKSYKKNDDGSLHLSLEAMERAQVENLQQTPEMFFASFSLLTNSFGDKDEETALVRRLIKSIEELSAGQQNFPVQITSRLNRGLPTQQFADLVAHYMPMNLNSKQKILEATDVNLRLRLILEAIEEERAINRLENEINQQVRTKIEENQREYMLREKLRTIKDELGESGGDDDLDKIRERLEKEPYPDAIKDKIKDELKRLEMMPPGSSEANVIRTYVDWLIQTPWYQKTDDVQDLQAVEDVLNDDHYGLVKIKERILEYLAVKQLTQSLKAPIICFSGPPGVGKTSLAKSIARALGRKFIKASLGGVRDEAEIRGHRRTYVGAMPGRIIQGMKKAGVMNPVFLLDEIDKLGADYKGDPSNALLEVLDPEQNKFFSDHFIEEPYDLSNVMFIATANYLEEIPAPLRDRLEIIELPSYTEIEKLEIAKTHLVKKAILENGLVEKQIKFSDDSLMFLIRYYTREAGVRQLERLLGTIARKTAVRILKTKRKTVFPITEEIIIELIGRQKFDYGHKEKKDQVGVVMGLAYTQFGGDILPVEVSYFEGKGEVKLTGNLGKVMTESASIALSYMQANAKKLGISSEMFTKNSLHIHFPEGAIPKDGPSAGVTMTTALISAFTGRPARADVAMTGEITLRGQVLPIGGLREKSLAAHRSGIKQIFIPKDNVKDLEDVPEIVKKDITITPVGTIEEIIAQVLKEPVSNE